MFLSNCIFHLKNNCHVSGVQTCFSEVYPFWESFAHTAAARMEKVLPSGNLLWLYTHLCLGTENHAIKILDTPIHYFV